MFKKIALKNNLRIITVPQKNTQSVTILVLVGTGSKYEKKEVNGISHFLEHMYFKGTKKRPSTTAVAETLDRVGGIYNAFTGEEYTGYFAKVASSHFDLALDWVSDIFLNSLLPEKSDFEDYTYGERIGGVLKLGLVDIDARRTAKRGVTQLDYVIKLLKETPETNRAVIEVGRAEDLLLRHPPCLRYIQMKVRYEKLHMWTVWRTWDSWGGLPSNLAALQLMKEYVAKEVGTDDGEMFAFSAGLHLYDDEWELAEKVCSSRSRTTIGDMLGRKDAAVSKED